MAIQDFTKYLGQEVKFICCRCPDSEVFKHTYDLVQARIVEVSICLDETENVFTIEDDDNFYLFKDTEFLEEFPSIFDVPSMFGTMEAPV